MNVASLDPHRQATADAFAGDPGRRRAPRLPIDRRILLRRARGHVIATHARDISPGGIGIRCGLATAYLLNFDGPAGLAAQGGLLDIRLALPFAEGLLAFEARVRLHYQVALGDDEALLGLRFVAMTEVHRDGLLGYLVDARRRTFARA